MIIWKKKKKRAYFNIFIILSFQQCLNFYLNWIFSLEITTDFKSEGKKTQVIPEIWINFDEAELKQSWTEFFCCGLRWMEFFLSVQHELFSFYFNGLVKIQSHTHTYTQICLPDQHTPRSEWLFFPSSCTPFNSEAKPFTQLTPDSQNPSNKAPLLSAAKLH